MDPDANLEEQRRRAKRIISGTFTLEDVDRLAELVEALDEWLSKGGFPPKAWKKETSTG